MGDGDMDEHLSSKQNMLVTWSTSSISAVVNVSNISLTVTINMYVYNINDYLLKICSCLSILEVKFNLNTSRKSCLGDFVRG